MTAPAAFDPALLDPATEVLPLADDARDALLATATARGFLCVRIELAGCTSKAELLRRVAGAMRFPDWFGHNWDALADCLGDLSWLHAPGYVVVLEHPQGLHRAEPETFAVALEVFAEAAAWWGEENVPFRVFVSGDEASAGAGNTSPPPAPAAGR